MKKFLLSICLILTLLAQRADAAFPVTFATLSGGNQPASLLDTMFGVVGTMGQVMCSASGTNTVLLTPIANMPTQSSYANYQEYGFVVANTSTGSVTVNVSSLGGLPLYLSDGVTQAASGTLVAGSYYLIVYNSALNSASGGFQIVGISSGVLPSPITNSLSGNVSLNNTSNYFDGPSVAQGTSGTWFASGTITVADTAGAADILVKLWDGTTVIASTQMHITTANTGVAIALSGYLTSPAGNIRMSAKDNASTNGVMWNNNTGNGKDSTLTAFRIN